MDSSLISELEKHIEIQITEKTPSLLKLFPLDKYITTFNIDSGFYGYKTVGIEAKKYCDSILQTGDKHLLQLYHKLILLKLVQSSLTRLQAENLPKEIVDLYYQHFERIVGDLSIANDDFYEYSDDKFCKDLALCTMKMIPVGALLIEKARLPKRFLVQDGLGQFIKGALFIVFKLQGLGPMYQMHFDSRRKSMSLAEFSAEGWQRAYMRMADMLALNPHIKGVFGSTWFGDPQLKRISPKLGFVHDLVAENGGAVFKAATSESAVKDALLRSPTRRKLYEQGLYTPTNYIGLWPRDALTAWAERMRKKGL